MTTAPGAHRGEPPGRCSLAGRGDFDTDPEPALDGRRGYLPRGRMLGGSSSINGMVYIRGNRADFAEWAEVAGDAWSYEHVLPYFKRSEDNERGADAYHGVGGPLGVADGRSGITLPDVWVEAAVQAGYEHNADFNGAIQEGVGRYQVTQRDGLRSSSASASSSRLTTARPTIVRGNTNAATLMIAEKAADLIRGRPAPAPESSPGVTPRVPPNGTGRATQAPRPSSVLSPDEEG